LPADVYVVVQVAISEDEIALDAQSTVPLSVKATVPPFGTGVTGAV
jgi:hypothetical protein